MSETMQMDQAVEAPAPVANLDGAQSARPVQRKSNFFGRIGGGFFRGLPTLGILLVLGGLAYWGHHTGWKMPSLSELTGQAADRENDWCEEHGVFESDCVLCNPDSKHMPKSYGWCSVHGVHDCPFEHPDVAQLGAVPKITQLDLDRAKRALDFADRPKNSSRCKLHPTLVQVASDEMVKKLGLSFEPVWTEPIEEVVTANGEIIYDQTRVASLSSMLPGKVWRVQKQEGDTVKEGDVLALIDAVGVGKAKAEFLKTLAELHLRRKNVERLRPLAGTVVSEAKMLEEEAALTKAEASVVSAKQALNNLGIPIPSQHLQRLSSAQLNRAMQFIGLPEGIVSTLDAKTTTANLIAVRASLGGIIVKRKVVEGEMVDPSRSLFIIANLQTMWLKLYVAAKDARLLKLAQEVRFQHEGSATPAIGKISWISTSVDEKTRTIQVRANLRNPKGHLRANTFGSGTILLRREAEAIVVPNNAIHSDGNCSIVFVQDKNFHKKGHPKILHVRTVRLGARTSGRTEIIAGLLKGENVVTNGSGVLRSQLLKSNLGAG